MKNATNLPGPVRDRYAPSPTGLQHIGGIRTALFNYLFARSKGGRFILRLEDTDRTRFDPEFVQNLYDTFDWLGIRWDEGPNTGGPAGPYIQSERTSLYTQYAEELLGKGQAYRCFCSAARLEEVRQEREAAHSGESGYDRRCRDISPEESARRAGAGEAFTIRLKIPLGENTRFHDYLLGDIEWKNDDINPDPVLLKSDGFPTYHLANVVDDHLMGISHILRAQEWLASTPLHVILYRAFGWEHPEFCHLPMVMGPDGKKLSKRHGATSIDEFRRQGYLPEALLNYVALLGCSWEEGKDLYTVGELEERFSLDKLNKAPGVFDYKKLEWYNGQYIRQKSDADLAALALPWAVAEGLFGTGAPGTEPGAEEGALFTAAMPLVKERLVLLSEVPQKLAYLFAEPPMPEAAEFFPKKADLSQTTALLKMGRELVEPLAALSDEEAENLIKTCAEKAGVKLGDLLMPLRVAITGARISPPLFGSLRLLGARRSLERVDRALAALG
ncbi:MAG: glutamate--tRNA ligase [Treponema sp.]|jgi:glutamyl-tRNA synthetase|nr:glutamate--tRNA ligase [Treponema sp.]